MFLYCNRLSLHWNGRGVKNYVHTAGPGPGAPLPRVGSPTPDGSPTAGPGPYRALSSRRLVAPMNCMISAAPMMELTLPQSREGATSTMSIARHLGC